MKFLVCLLLGHRTWHHPGPPLGWVGGEYIGRERSPSLATCYRCGRTWTVYSVPKGLLEALKGE